MNNENIPDFIKENAKKSSVKSTNPEELIKNFDKNAVQKKLREIGMGDIAKKLEGLNESDIKKLINSNPQILKKAMQIINDGLRILDCNCQ